MSSSSTTTNTRGPLCGPPPPTPSSPNLNDSAKLSAGHNTRGWLYRAVRSLKADIRKRQLRVTKRPFVADSNLVGPVLLVSPPIDPDSESRCRNLLKRMHYEPI